MSKLRVKVPKNDGEYLEVANELQTAYNARELQFQNQLRQCHNVIADLAHAMMKQETIIDAHVQMLALLQKSGLLKRSAATRDHSPTQPPPMTVQTLNHYRQSILTQIEEDRWHQADFIDSIVDVANWRGSKSIQYHEQNKSKDFIAEARTSYGFIPVESGSLWRPEEERDDDAPDPIDFYQNLQSVATGFYTPPRRLSAEEEHNNEE